MSRKRETGGASGEERRVALAEQREEQQAEQRRVELAEGRKEDQAEQWQETRLRINEGAWTRKKFGRDWRGRGHIFNLLPRRKRLRDG